MKLFFVRHGETDWNKERKIQGRSDILLNEFGRTLARKTAQGLSDIAFDICYTSPLARARETAEIILEGKKVPVIEDGNIIEMKFGTYEGKCCAKKDRNVPEAFRKFFEDPVHYETPEGGEHFTDVLKRTDLFLNMLYENEQMQSSNILITTHGAALAAILTNIKQEPLFRFWGMGVHKNCAVTEVEVKNKIPMILSENKVYYDDEVEPWEE